MVFGQDQKISAHNHRKHKMQEHKLGCTVLSAVQYSELKHTDPNSQQIGVAASSVLPTTL
jgi:hypothetical protein